MKINISCLLQAKYVQEDYLSQPCMVASTGRMAKIQVSEADEGNATTGEKKLDNTIQTVCNTECFMPL